jgi:hypothetical protein
MSIYVVKTPKARTRISGASLAHSKLDARQRACRAAQADHNEIHHTPTLRQRTAEFGVSVPYLQIARRLSPELREAIASGQDQTSFAELARCLDHAETAMATAIMTAIAAE